MNIKRSKHEVTLVTFRTILHKVLPFLHLNMTYMRHYAVCKYRIHSHEYDKTVDYALLRVLSSFLGCDGYDEYFYTWLIELKQLDVKLISMWLMDSDMDGVEDL